MNAVYVVEMEYQKVNVTVMEVQMLAVDVVKLVRLVVIIPVVLL